jgi:predicted translin family RNA/ssDNA-binding protein
VTKLAVRREFNAVHLLISKMLTRDTTDYFRFSTTFSSGLQEYIEALSFWKFLCDGSLISKAQIEAEICADSNVQIQIPLFDYLFGLCDLSFVLFSHYPLHFQLFAHILNLFFSGELMRFAINTVSAGDRATVFSVCRFVRDLQTAFMAIQLPHRDYSQKADTMLASIMKIEKSTCCSVSLTAIFFHIHLSFLEIIACFHIRMFLSVCYKVAVRGTKFSSSMVLADDARPVAAE